MLIKPFVAITMRINYTTDAFESLAKLVNFIETANTGGAGMRWLNRYESFLEKKLLNAHRTKLCNNITLQKLNLHCIYFNDWLIAFSIHGDSMLIETLWHKSRISD